MPNKLTGYPRIAVIRQGTLNNKYHYALYDDTINVGDEVLVSGKAMGEIWKIEDIFSADDTSPCMTEHITEEIICKVDTSAYKARCSRRKQAAEIKKQMDTEIKKMQHDEVYELYASRNPVLAELLRMYKELT